MRQRIWQFLLLVSSLLLSGAIDCSYKRPSVVIQLSRTHVLRTWQPDGAHCRWWENRQSETNQFPAAVQSGPRWLVMQLRQAMRLEAVSVQSWDGQWHAAALLGWPVSALVASSLPLELQLQDPCRASWETFGSSDHWRELRNTETEKPIISYILLRSSVRLDYAAVKLTGVDSSPLELSVTNVAMCPERNPGAMGDGATICFSVRGCLQPGDSRGQLPSCFITADVAQNEWLKPLRSINASEGLVEAQFSLEARHRHHNQQLVCGNGRLRLERTLGIIADPAEVSLSVSPVWVLGRQVSINFTSFDSYPEPLHQCQISLASGSVRNMTPVAMTRWPTKSKLDRIVVSRTSYFVTAVTGSMQNASVSCNAILQNQFVKKIGDAYAVSQISKPCATEIYMGYFCGHRKIDEQSRQIHVTSHDCTIWGVSHQCWLVNASRNQITEALHKIKQDNFMSIHLLHIRDWMQSNSWLVRCSVHQSGVAYPIVETKPVELRDTSQQQSMNTAFLFTAVIALVIMFVATALLVTFRIRMRRSNRDFFSGKSAARNNRKPAGGSVGSPLSRPFSTHHNADPYENEYPTLNPVQVGKSLKSKKSSNDVPLRMKLKSQPQAMQHKPQAGDSSDEYVKMASDVDILSRSLPEKRLGHRGDGHLN